MITDTQEVIAMGQLWSQDVRVVQLQVTELQSQLTAKEEEIKRLREELNDLQGRDERFREQQRLVTELQSILEINEEDMRILRQQQRETQQQETGPREWLINQNEIQLTDQERGELFTGENSMVVTSL